MSQMCVSCGAENPATNRFCGQCGIRLEQANSAVASAANVAGGGRAIADAGGNAIDGAPANSGASEPLNKYRIVVENANTAHTGSGFLGLSGDSTTPDYEDEERTAPSHLWRNIAICVVVIALAMTASQWRTIRDYNLRRHSPVSAPDASQIAEPPPPSAVAADRADRTSGVPSSEPGADAPQVVESTPSPDHARPVQQTGRSRESAPSSGRSNSSANAARPRAMGGPVADLPASPSSAASNQPARFRTAHPVDSPSSTTAPGAYEMNRAANASDAEARAAWLWNAVSKGNSQASVELARMYVQGSGVVRNCEQAQILLRGAAGKGNEQARLGLRQILQGGCAPR